MSPLDWWVENYGKYTPAGFVLRAQLTDHWVRVHSLPQSKRYPETPIEYETLIQRHDELTKFLFAPGEECVLFKSTRFWPEDGLPPEKPILSGFELADEYVTLAQYPEELPIEHDDIYCVGYSLVTWKPAKFSSLVTAVADEETYGVAVVSMSTKNIYCPYDGGADIFVFNRSPEVVRTHFKEWLSSRADFL